MPRRTNPNRKLNTFSHSTVWAMGSAHRSPQTNQTPYGGSRGSGSAGWPPSGDAPGGSTSFGYGEVGLLGVWLLGVWLLRVWLTRWRAQLARTRCRASALLPDR